MELKRVVVTGLGAVTPVGNTPEEMWQNMVNGVSGAAPITLFDTSLFKTKFACEVKNLNINDYLDRKEARKMDRYTDCCHPGREGLRLGLGAGGQEPHRCGLRRWHRRYQNLRGRGVVLRSEPGKWS